MRRRNEKVVDMVTAALTVVAMAIEYRRTHYDKAPIGVTILYYGHRACQRMALHIGRVGMVLERAYRESV